MVERHACYPNRAAMFWIRKDGREEKITFAELDRLAAASPTSCRAWECKRATG